MGGDQALHLDIRTVIHDERHSDFAADDRCGVVRGFGMNPQDIPVGTVFQTKAVFAVPFEKRLPFMLSGEGDRCGRGAVVRVYATLNAGQTGGAPGVGPSIRTKVSPGWSRRLELKTLAKVFHGELVEVPRLLSDPLGDK